MVDNTSKIHVCFPVYDFSDDYIRHTGAAIASILMNTSRSVAIHLLYDKDVSNQHLDLSTANLNKMYSLCSKYGGSIYLHDVTLPDSVLSIPALKSYNPATLLRLSIPNVLRDIEKVIYLDSDIIVKMDLSDLWDVDMGEYCLAAVPDRMKSIGARKAVGWKFYFSSSIKKLYSDVLNPDKYFIASLLLMDLEKIRKIIPDFFMECIHFLDHHPKAPLSDQDTLNYLLQNSCKFLDYRYNLGPLDVDGDTMGDYIIHFGGDNKPWRIYNGPIDNEYWYYLSMTPWGEGIHCFDYIRQAPAKQYLNNCILYSNNGALLRICLSLIKVYLKKNLNKILRFIEFVC